MTGAFSVTLQTEIIFLLEIKIKQNPDCPNKECKRAYIKHAEATRGGGGGFYKFFRKKKSYTRSPWASISHGPVIFLENISRPLLPMLVSYIRLSCRSISG